MITIKKKLRHKLKWTDEELEYLENQWGNMPIDNIAKKLDRSVDAIRSKARHLNLGAFYDSATKGVTLSSVFRCIYHQKIDTYDRNKWKSLGLKTVRRRRLKHEAEFVDMKDFWEWAEENQSYLDFSQFNQYDLGEEPKWVNEKRHKDQLKKHTVQEVRSDNQRKWNYAEEERLKRLVAEQTKTMTEIAEMLNRSPRAIKNKLYRMGFGQMPATNKSRPKWNKPDTETLMSMVAEGKASYDIANALNRTVPSVDEKIRRLYGTCNRHKVEKIIKKRC